MSAQILAFSPQSPPAEVSGLKIVGLLTADGVEIDVHGPCGCCGLYKLIYPCGFTQHVSAERLSALLGAI